MEIRKVGVLGAGQMGLGIAQAAARAGFDTFMAKATPGGPSVSTMTLTIWSSHTPSRARSAT